MVEGEPRAGRASQIEIAKSVFENKVVMCKCDIAGLWLWWGLQGTARVQQSASYLEEAVPLQPGGPATDAPREGSKGLCLRWVNKIKAFIDPTLGEIYIITVNNNSKVQKKENYINFNNQILIFN